jgi:hypothetical protein
LNEELPSVTSGRSLLLPLETKAAEFRRRVVEHHREALRSNDEDAVRRIGAVVDVARIDAVVARRRASTAR